MEKEEYFGDGDQQALLKRGRALSQLLKHDKRFSYYGRTVGVATTEDGDLEPIVTNAARCMNVGFERWSKKALVKFCFIREHRLKPFS